MWWYNNTLLFRERKIINPDQIKFQPQKAKGKDKEDIKDEHQKILKACANLWSNRC